MTFFMQTTDLDLGHTPIENIFINDFMPIADGTYVKVYLLGYKYAYDKDDTISLNNDTISKHLNIPLSDVLKAWDFWENKGIIKKHYEEANDEYNYKVEFINLKQLLIKNNFSNVQENFHDEVFKKPFTCSPEDLSKAKEDPKVNSMFNEVRKIIRRYLTPNECLKIYEWMTNYNMSGDMIVRAFQFSSQNKNRRTLSYVEGVIRTWYDNDVTNLEALQEYFETNDEKHYRYEKIMKSLGFKGRYLTNGEKKVIDKWFNKWHFKLEIVLRACDYTKNISNPNINYIDKILNKWFNEGIQTLNQVDENDKQKENKNQSSYKKSNSSKKKPIKTRFHNFEQRTSKYTADQLEQIAKNIRKKHSKGVND